MSKEVEREVAPKEFTVSADHLARVRREAGRRPAREIEVAEGVTLHDLREAEARADRKRDRERRARAEATTADAAANMPATFRVTAGEGGVVIMPAPEAEEAGEGSASGEAADGGTADASATADATAGTSAEPPLADARTSGESSSPPTPQPAKTPRRPKADTP
ncbi:MAG TPA: hypothetical protein VK421_06045 [Pyrinomonadaceae bacterium]|nr:hypothetical protein [Pyrinomonadaceae bacterium]